MSRTTERMGVYGLVNGLGFHGRPEEKTRLVRSLERAIARADWDRVLALIASYGFGAYLGSSLRQFIGRKVE